MKTLYDTGNEPAAAQCLLAWLLIFFPNMKNTQFFHIPATYGGP